jgi:hypothetical protein
VKFNFVMLIMDTRVGSGSTAPNKRSKHEKVWKETQDNRKLSDRALGFLNRLCGIMEQDNLRKLQNLLNDLESVDMSTLDPLTEESNGLDIITRCITLETTESEASLNLMISLIHFSLWVSR